MLLARLVIAGVLAALAVFGWWWPNRPQPLPNPHVGPVASMSFAPFRDGQSPLARIYPSRAEVEADLKLLVGKTRAIRTYTSLEGMEVVPPLARKYGFEVTHSAWIGAKPVENDREISALIAAANAYPDVIKRVIVGNEVLLRNEFREGFSEDRKRTIEALIGYLRRVKAAVKQPVGYAEVWEFWLRYPEVAPYVDVVIGHLLPYWEDDPHGVARAMPQIRHGYEALKSRFPGKEIWIGEVGWPSAGRARADARPSRFNEARFVTDFLALAREMGADYNLIEAFDQSWKSKLEGTVGGAWGLYTADRQPKFDLAGPVVELPEWKALAGASVFLAFLAILWHWRRRPEAGAREVLLFSLAAQAMAAAVVLGAYVAWLHGFTLETQASGLAKTMLQTLLAIFVLREIARGDVAPGLRGFDAAIVAIRKRPWPPAFSADAVYVASVGYALALGWILATIPRYRDFPLADFLVLAIAVPLLGLRRGFGESRRIDGAVVGLLLVAAAATLWREGALNREAQIWAGMLALIALPRALAFIRPRA